MLDSAWKAVCGLNSSQFFANHCPEAAHSFVVSLTERKIQHQLKGKNMSKSDKKQDASIVWFEIPADDPERAKSFYSNLFGWKINPFPGSGDYSHIDTGSADDTPDGALKRRQRPQEPIINYVSVDSVDKYADKTAKLGGKIKMDTCCCFAEMTGTKVFRRKKHRK